MNFKELMEFPIQYEDNDVSVLMGCYYSYLDDNIDRYSLDHEALKLQERVKIKYYKDFCFDGRRVWRLYSVWLDNQLVMLCKNAGREGDDHSGFVIFNAELYKNLNAFILTFTNSPVSTFKVTQLDENADEFYSFYSNSVDGYFEYY